MEKTYFNPGLSAEDSSSKKIYKKATHNIDIVFN